MPEQGARNFAERISRIGDDQLCRARRHWQLPVRDNRHRAAVDSVRREARAVEVLTLYCDKDVAGLNLAVVIAGRPHLYVAPADQAGARKSGGKLAQLHGAECREGWTRIQINAARRPP